MSDARTPAKGAPVAVPVVVPVVVSVVDESDLVRAGVAVLLGRDDRIRIASASAPSPPVDVLLCDPTGRAEGVETYLAAVRARFGAKVLTFTWEVRPAGVRRMLAAGASGCVSKAAGPAELAAAVVAVARGEWRPPTEEGVAGGPELRPREADVLVWICRGLSNQEIADELSISVNSVKTYARQVYAKIGVSSRSQAVAWGISRGF